jgi:phosphatidylserine/phosphatidylglycerophosphate/cardiolipin synthase-like enzyme
MKHVQRAYIYSLLFAISLFFCITCGPYSNGLGKTHFVIGCSPAMYLSCGKSHNIVPDLSSAPLPSCPLSLNADGRICCTLFAPDDDWHAVLLWLIEQEKEKICLAVYLLTDKRIADALCNARMRGITIEVVTDQTCVHDRSNKLGRLHQAGIPIYIYKPVDNRSIMTPLMHNKFILFTTSLHNRSLVWTGSANCTRSAASHQENIIIMDDINVFLHYTKQYEELKKRSRYYVPLA